MLFWSVLLGVSLIGVFSIPFIGVFRRVNREEDLNDEDLQEGLNSVKNIVRSVTKSSSKKIGGSIKSAYSKGLSKIGETRVSGLVKGQGILKKSDTRSDFLRDVQEHKEKIREELTNGNDKKKEEKEK